MSGLAVSYGFSLVGGFVAIVEHESDRENAK